MKFTADVFKRAFDQATMSTPTAFIHMLYDDDYTLKESAALAIADELSKMGYWIEEVLFDEE